MKIAITGTVMTLGLLGFVAIALADEEKIMPKDLPGAVLDAVKGKFPGAETTWAAKETEDGKTTFEVTLKDKGKNVDVALTAEGKIVEIEREVTAGDAPKAVASAIEAKYPKATVKKVEEIVEFEGEKESKSYEFLLTTADKKTLEVKLSPEGNILKTEEDKDDEGAGN